MAKAIDHTPRSTARTRRRRRPDPRRIKINRTYAAGEAAVILGVHKNTVREWLRRGLAAIDDRRPLLILGTELRRYLDARKIAGKRPCGPNELYCVRDRAPKRPDGGMVDYLPITSTSGNLQGLCPDCGSLIYRRVSRAKLALVCPDLDVVFFRGHSDD